MNGRAHFVMGAATLAAPSILIAKNPGLALGLGLISGLSALLPDLDHPEGSLAKKVLGPLGPPAQWLTRRTSRTARHLSTRHDREAWARGQSRGHDPDHRALTHTLAAATAWALLVALTTSPTLGPLPAVAAFAGWASHVFSDGLTKAGTPMLWPLQVRGQRWYRVRLGRLTSSRPLTDWAVAWGWSIAAVCLCTAL